MAPLVFSGVVADFIRDTSREISIEGGVRAGKTTAALWKVRQSCADHRGIKWFVCRYSNTDTEDKLRRQWEEVIAQFDGDIPTWNASTHSYDFENGSSVIMFGLKAADARSRYSKLRGLGVAGIMVDEAQEMPADIALELRGRLSQQGFPVQLIFVSNPMNVDSWLAKQFPIKDTISGRKYFAVSMYDNGANLPDEMIAGLEAAYPPEHAKYASIILGQRGVNVEGTPVYDGVFNRALHVQPVAFAATQPLLEAFDIGQRNVAWIVAQRIYAGGLAFLGGVLGQELFLEDFLPIVQEYRTQWFRHLSSVRTCCASPGGTVSSKNRYTNVALLKRAGFRPMFTDYGNTPDVVLAMIESLAAYMRGMNDDDEPRLAVNNNPERWIRASREGRVPCPFVAQAFEAGYAWDEHKVSVGNNKISQPREDDWFIHGMRCAENIELNFCAHRPTPQERDARLRATRSMRYIDNPDEAALLRGPHGWLA